MYKLTQTTAIKRLADGAVIPADPANDDYKKYIAWVALGNSVIPADVPTALQMWERIKAERDRRSSSGVLVGTKWFHSDDRSRIQQLGLLSMGASIPANLLWKTMDGTFVTMTQTLAGQVFGASAAGDQAIFAKAEWHKAQMEAAPVPGNYDFSGGWPAVFV